MPRQDVTQRVLARLIMAQGAVVPDRVLLAAAYGDGRGRIGTLRTLLFRVRQSLPRPAAIERVRGLGYRLDPAAAPLLPPVDARLLVPAPRPK
jgi:DNA-binding response OmpR family regulator